jgi:hypothetical protein
MMKRQTVLASIAILFILALTVSQVFAAGPAGGAGEKPNGDEPGAVATAKAEERETRQEEKAQNKDQDKDQNKDQNKDKDKDKNNNAGGVDPDKKEKTKPEDPKEKKTDKKYLHFKGTIESVAEDGSSLELLVGEETISIGMNGDTKVIIPTMGQDSEGVGLEEGVQVSIKAIKIINEEEANEEIIAVQIHVIPGKPEHIHHVGLVTAFDQANDGTGSITVSTGPDSETTYLLTNDTVFKPERPEDDEMIGIRVTVINRRDVTGAGQFAQGIVFHPDLVTSN